MNESMNGCPTAAWSLFILVESSQHHLSTWFRKLMRSGIPCADIVRDSSKALSFHLVIYAREGIFQK